MKRIRAFDQHKTMKIANFFGIHTGSLYEDKGKIALVNWKNSTDNCNVLSFVL